MEGAEVESKLENVHSILTRDRHHVALHSPLPPSPMTTRRMGAQNTL